MPRGSRPSSVLEYVARSGCGVCAVNEVWACLLLQQPGLIEWFIDALILPLLLSSNLPPPPRVMTMVCLFCLSLLMLTSCSRYGRALSVA